MKAPLKRRLAAAGAVLVIAYAVFAWWWQYSGSLADLPLRVENDAGVFTLATAPKVARTEAGGAACHDRMYVVGGIDAWARTLTSVESYDPASHTWRTEPDLPRPINHPAVVCADDRLYVIGGFGPIGLRPRGAMIARWDPMDTVFVLEAGASFWRLGTPLPEPRGAGGATFVDGAIWYVGGIDAMREITGAFFRFDLASAQWTRLAPMPTSRDHLKLEAIGRALYAVGGRKDDIRKNVVATERYDIDAQTWSRVADIGIPRGALATAVVGGYLYAFGGEFLWTCAEAVERYDPRADRWEVVGELPEARHGICAGVLDGAIHLVTGGRHPRVSISAIHRVFVPRGELP